MPDKLKSTMAVPVTFVEGEAPTPSKLNAMSAQMKNMSLQLERATGDIHDESHPYSQYTDARLSTPWGQEPASEAGLSGAVRRPLGIVNLARAIGPMSNLNPRTLPGVVSTIVEEIPIGKFEWSLLYNPDSNLTVTLADSNPAVFVTLVDTGSIVAAGDYSVTPKGFVNSFLPTTGGTASYPYTPSIQGGYLSPNGSSFNVIPDPNQVQVGASAVVVTGPDGFGEYTVTLPLASAQQGNWNESSTVLTVADPNYLAQLKLPEYLTTQYIDGEVFPEGIIFLRNKTTGFLYSLGIYIAASGTTFRIRNVDLVAAIAAGQIFEVITVGTDITTSIDDIRKKQNHSHDRHWGEPPIDINSIFGWCVNEGLSGVWVPSQINSNYAPQYLHRDGYRPSLDLGGDGNALRGNLMLGLELGTPGTYVGATGASFAVKFGGTNWTISKTIDEAMVFTTSAGSDEYYEFQDSPIRIEKGIIGSDKGSNPALKPVKMYAYEDGITGGFTSAGASVTTVPLLALPSASYNLLSCSVLIEKTVAGLWIPPSWDPAANEDDLYYVSFFVDTGTWSISIQTLAGWVGSATVTLKTVIHYEDL